MIAEVGLSNFTVLAFAARDQRHNGNSVTYCQVILYFIAAVYDLACKFMSDRCREMVSSFYHYPRNIRSANTAAFYFDQYLCIFLNMRNVYLHTSDIFWSK